VAALSPEEIKRQELYRDARFKKQYDDIWQSVGKCVFCDLNEKYVFFEENGVVMTISLYAYIDGHFMIVPRRHITSTKDLTQLEWETIRKFTYIAKKLFKDIHHVKGMQLVQKMGTAAQSTVEHIHFHCIPFDKPDLAVWNYRQLKHTPLENVALYKKARKQIINYDQKFDAKYRQASSLPMVVDLIALNEKDQVLFQKRRHKLNPDYITFPGGVVQDYSKGLEAELIREVKEETGVRLPKSEIHLFSSRTGNIHYALNEKHLKVTYARESHFFWNTYVTSHISSNTKLVPGDDCEGFVWVHRDKIEQHPRISPGIKEIMRAYGRSH